MKKKYTYLIIIFLIVASLAAFGRIAGNDFINFDDNIYVTENIHTKSGITADGFHWAFSTKYFNLWIPLTWISLMLDYQLYGLSPGGYHITNLILHILSTLLLFGLFYRMTGAIWKSAFVAALFSLHPMHVESVAWISERKDVLSTFFWMLTLCLYVYYTEKPAIKRYLLVLFSFILALLSKPIVVTLPVIMILLDYWPLRRFESKKDNLILWQLKEKIPLFILSFILVIITFYTPNEQEVFSKGFSLNSRLANALINFITYLAKTFWPTNLAIYYPFPPHFSLWQILGASLLIIVICLGVVFMARRLPYLFIGWMWYLITIVPVIGIIQIGSHVMADRYHYLPSIGIGIMLAWGMPCLIRNDDIRKYFLYPAAIAFLAFLVVLTWRQCGYWRDSITLFSHTLNVTDDNYIAHNHLASALLKERNFEKAIYHYNEAIRINPVYAHAYYNRGITYYILGQKQLALNDFKETIRTIPKIPKFVAAYNNIGVTYSDLGQYQSAVESLSEAIRIKPDYADAWNNRANIYLKHDDKISGCRDAKKACEMGNCSTLQDATGKRLCR